MSLRHRRLLVEALWCCGKQIDVQKAALFLYSWPRHFCLDRIIWHEIGRGIYRSSNPMTTDGRHVCLHSPGFCSWRRCWSNSWLLPVVSVWPRNSRTWDSWQAFGAESGWKWTRKCLAVPYLEGERSDPDFNSRSWSEFPLGATVPSTWAQRRHRPVRGPWGRSPSPASPALALDPLCGVASNKSLHISGPIKFHASEVRDNYLSPRAFMSIRGDNGCECVSHVSNVGEFMLVQ